MSRSNRPALTFRELIAILACVTIVMVVVHMLLFSPRRGSDVMRLKDATQVRAIHQSFLVFSGEFKGMYPTPSLIRAKSADTIEIELAHGDAEDVTLNTTANLFSACIMLNYFNPEFCIGATEPSLRIAVCEDYNYEAYSPAHGILWDRNFHADLHDRSHVSYAHLPVFGDARLKHWRETMGGKHPVVGNRGPLGGTSDSASITLRIHQPFNRWSGHIVLGDGSVDFTDAFPVMARPADGGYRIAPECLSSSGQIPPDDALITFTKQMTTDGPVIQHD